MYIKIVNTDNKYKCIVMRGNDPSRIDRGEGYRAVNRLNWCDVLLGTDGVHPGSIKVVFLFFLIFVVSIREKEERKREIHF